MIDVGGIGIILTINKKMLFHLESWKILWYTKWSQSFVHTSLENGACFLVEFGASSPKHGNICRITICTGACGDSSNSELFWKATESTAACCKFIQHQSIFLQHSTAHIWHACFVAALVEVTSVKIAGCLAIHACAELYTSNRTMKVPFGSVRIAHVSFSMWVILMAFIICNLVSAQDYESYYVDPPIEADPEEPRPQGSDTDPPGVDSFPDASGDHATVPVTPGSPCLPQLPNIRWATCTIQMSGRF
jgi:hypothetical protein